MKLFHVVPLIIVIMPIAYALIRLALRRRGGATRSAPRIDVLFATRYEASSRHKARLLGNLVR